MWECHPFRVCAVVTHLARLGKLVNGCLNAKGAVNSGPPPFRNLYLGLFEPCVKVIVTIQDAWVTVHWPPTSATYT